MIDEQWRAVAEEVDAALYRVETELGALRDVLRRAGLPVRRQRVRVTGENGAARAALEVLKRQGLAPIGPAAVARLIHVSPEYAFDLLASLVASGFAERVGRGRYRARAGSTGA